MCILIGQQLCFHCSMKQENGFIDIIGYLQVVRICSFVKHDMYCSYVCNSQLVKGIAL